MKITPKLNKIIHSAMEKRVMNAYNKKIDFIFHQRPDLNKKVNEEISQKHIQLYSQLHLPCSDKWLRLYSNLTGVIDYTYLPDDLFYAKIERIINNCDRTNGDLEDKNLTSIFIDEKNLPRTHLRYVRGIFFNENYEVLTHKQVLNIIHSDLGNCIGKVATESLGGHGVNLFSFKDNRYYTSKNEELTIDWIKSRGESYIFQEAITQCEFTARFNPYSANTCRITTLRCPWNGQIIVCKAAIRLGVGPVAIDNLSSGGIATAINSHGELGPYAYRWNGMKKFDRHPSSGVAFKGLIHPFYKKMCDTVIHYAKKIPNYNLISWDVIADYKGEIKIIELNLTGQGTHIHQFAFGSFFGEHTESLINWIAAHSELDTFKHIRTF